MDKIEVEFRRLQDLGIITPVQHSEWAAPIVPIMKRDSSMRLRSDYKVIVKVLIPDNYPLPRIEDIFAALQERKFSKLDLSQAYQQLPLDPDSKKFTTINLIKVLFSLSVYHLGFLQLLVFFNISWRTSSRAFQMSVFT